MQSFDFLVRVIKYKNIKITATDLESAKKVVDTQLRKEGFHYIEIVDVQDVDINEEPKPELLVEDTNDTINQEVEEGN